MAESPFAKELVERVQRVTRQRRLTYPGDLGTEPTDPNLVAGYLDNELEPEQVAEFEKRCLTSDVHLAEVASVHQVLSLIGQKAKVPADARQRMYRLVRGRETTKPEPEARRQVGPEAESQAPAPVAPSLRSLRADLGLVVHPRPVDPRWNGSARPPPCWRPDRDPAALGRLLEPQFAEPDPKSPSI